MARAAAKSSRTSRPKARPTGSAAAREVKFSNLDKIFFPKTRFTKGDLIQYYIAVAPYMLPHLHDRPVTLIRFGPAEALRNAAQRRPNSRDYT